jgi:Methylase involved in ubiquinone/menaquinone biosynthesis
MDNGTSEAVIGQFDKIALLPDAWDHNRHYQRDILSLAGRRRKALDLGCGTGELSRSLALRCSEVVGVDASGGMISEARRRNWGLNIDYLEADAESYLRGRENEFDFIASVAAFHHMDEARMLSLCEKALAPGGTLVVLDLFQESSLGDYLVSGAATALNPIYSLVHTGRLSADRREREAWAAHSPNDRFLSLPRLRAIAKETLGDFTLERKLFWRYLLVHEKKRAPRAAA